MRPFAYFVIMLLFISILASGCKSDPSVPVINTLDVTGITDKSAVGGGDIINDGGAKIDEIGLIWGTSFNISLDNHEGKVSKKSDKAIFTFLLTDLEPATTYFVKAFAINSAGTAYGSYKQFTTLVTLPEIETLDVIHVSPNHVYAGGRILNYHDHSIIEAGVCWDLHPNPTKELNDHEIADLYYEEFGCYVSDLMPATKYYLRAFVTTKYGCSYGNEITFTTSEAFNVIGIGELKDSYTGSMQQITSDNVIEAVVVANDKSGNFFKKLILQDETGAIELLLDKTNLHIIYPVGQRVYVKCKNIYIGDYSNLIQLGYPFSSYIGRIPWQLIPNHLFRYPPPLVNIEPLALQTFDDLKLTMVSKLVKFENVHFSELGVPFAINHYNATNRILLDANGNEIMVRTSHFADFSDTLTPHGIGEITGILGVFGSTYQLFLRDINDLGHFAKQN